MLTEYGSFLVKIRVARCCYSACLQVLVSKKGIPCDGVTMYNEIKMMIVGILVGLWSVRVLVYTPLGMSAVE